MSANENREEEIFHEALRKSSATERAAFLDGACRNDPPLRARLEALIEGHLKAHGFLDAVPAASPEESPTVRGEVPVSERPGDRIGRYKLLQKIGEGGCGVVYMAEQEEPVRRRAALKIIKLGMDTRSVIARFEAERQALALMDHPNIATVYDAGATETGRPYFVMELVRGIKITEYCDQNNLPTGARLDLFVQVCHAIQHAHQKGIIHRDIKPSNILVTLHDGVPVPKVIDFGIAKATQQRLTDKTLFTAFEQFIGTPAYMSPEQAELSGLDIDTRSDVYSLGVLLYELLTGNTPFDAKTLLAAGLEEMRRTIREQEPPRPSTRLSTMLQADLTAVARQRQSDPPRLIHLLRGDLDWIVMKALEKDRTRRYVTAEGLALDIKRHLDNEPVVARPPSAAYRIQKFVRRNRVMVAAAACVAAVLVLGALVSTWQAIRATRAERAQSRLRQDAEKARADEARQRQRAEAGERYAQRLLYTADMNLVQQAWEQNNVGRVRQLLAETAAYPERRFEWYYWQRQTHLELKTLRGHSSGIWSVAFSPDGQRIVSGSEDQTAKVWEAATGNELLALKGHVAGIWSVAFSPDSQRLVTGSADQTAKVWEAASGKELLTLRGHSGWVDSVAFAPDGQRLVTGSWDGTAKVWEAVSGKELLTLKGHAAGIGSVAFSPDGQRIVTGSFDQTAKVWEAAGGKELLTLKGHSGAVRSAAFAPDGQRIVTGSWDGTAKVWEVASGKELLTLTGHSAGVRSVAFARDGQRVVTGSEDQTAKVWEAASGRELFTLKGHSAGVRSVAFSPDGQRIVTGGGDQTAKVWEAAAGNDLLTLKGHRAWVWSVAISPDGRRIVTGSFDGTAKVWEAASGKELLTLTGHSNAITSVALSPDGRRIVTGSVGDQTAKVWEAASGKELLTLKGHGAGIFAVAFSPDGRRIVTGSLDQMAKVWEAASGKPLLTFTNRGAYITSVSFSPDGRRLIAGRDDGTAKVWEAGNGKQLLTLKGHSALIWSVAFSPDGERIATGSSDQTAKVWDSASGKELLAFKGHSAPIYSVAFSPDGQRILTGGGDKTAKVWEAASGNELLTLKGHNGQIRSVAFAADGQRIVTGSDDQTAIVWQAATAQQLAAWQREEQEASGRLELLRREQAAAAENALALRAQDPGAIKQWLVLAPVPFAGRSGVALAQEQIPQEARLRPRDGERVKVGQTEQIWRAVQLEDYLINFNHLLGQVTQRSVAYAVCYIQSDADQTGLLMKVGCDDQAKVYLNGKEIYQCGEGRSYVPDQDVVAGVELKAGPNVLVFKVVNEIDAWQGSLWLTDAAGQPLKGIRVTLTPP